MFLGTVILVSSLLTTVSSIDQQKLLKDAHPQDGLLKELILAEIIPTVIPTVFVPKLDLEVKWGHEKASVGNIVQTQKVQDPPHLNLIPKNASISDTLRSMQLTVILSDPDAPSRYDPKWSQFCHWIATNLTLGDADEGQHAYRNRYDEVMEWKPPGPPPKTGMHRYVFVALAPANGTHEALNLSQPADRKRWGYAGEREGLQRWLQENGLEIVGANFVYAQNKKQ